MANENTSEAPSTDPRVLAAAKALQQHFAAEDDLIAGFPLDEYICCAEIALKAADKAATAASK
jgi:hypothetical protein